MNRTKLVILLNVIIVLGPNSSRGAIDRSRETAITQAIKKVGPAVASINVLQKISIFCINWGEWFLLFLLGFSL